MRKFLLIFFMNLTSIINAQRPETGIWTAINLPVNFTKQWQWHTDAGYRTFGVSIQPVQYLFRTGARYNFNRELNIAAGVAFFFSKANFIKADHEFGKEFRFWEEINYNHLLNENWQILFRLRTEQRFFAPTSVKDKYTGYRFRIRPGINLKLNDRWNLQLTDEYFRQAAHEKFSFDQNRLTFSGIYQFNTSAQLQAGYLWIKWPADHQHVLTFTFTKNISWHAGK